MKILFDQLKGKNIVKFGFAQILSETEVLAVVGKVVVASLPDLVRQFADRKKIEYDMAETRFRSLIDLIDTPYINMESAMGHPCQNLADWKTLDDFDMPANGGKFVLSWAYHPKALPLAVPASTLYMAAKRGMDVTVLRPEGFQLPAPLMQT